MVFHIDYTNQGTWYKFPTSLGKPPRFLIILLFAGYCTNYVLNNDIIILLLYILLLVVKFQVILCLYSAYSAVGLRGWRILYLQIDTWSSGHLWYFLPF